MDIIARALAVKANSNLFNPSSRTNGYLVNNDGTLLSSANYSTSDFIPVVAGKLYYCSDIRSIAFYDANKVFIPFSGNYYNYNPPKSDTVIRAQSSAVYARVSSFTTNMSKSDYRFMLVNMPGKWNGVILAAYGDSLTAQNMWQPHTAERFGLVYTNYGVGGTRVSDGTGADTTAMCRDERINAITNNPAVITILGGTNDWAQNVAMGTLGSTDTTTFYGGLNVTFQKLITKFPTARIIAMTPPYQKYPSRAGWTDTTGVKNNLNFTTKDYGDAIIATAKSYGIPVIDLYSNVGWNDINISTYVTNDNPALLHPNTEGGKRIAELVVGQLKAIEPVY